MSCLHFASRTARAQDSYQFRVSYDLWCGADTAPPFYAYPGRISNNPHESMETRCVLPSMRNIAVPADCTRPQLGAGRNRYVSAAPAWNRTPGKITNPAFRSQLINPACKVGPLKSGLAVLLRMEMARMFARHLRAAGSLPPLSSPRTLYPYIPGPMAGKR